MSLQLDLYNWQSGQILCYVAQPDSVVLEVEVDRNSTAQDVLDKVCSTIGTVEGDYFGLQYVTCKRESFWLNLRNKFVGQLSGQPPYRLRLRVKYFVQPHLLLQATTRELFFKQLKSDIFSGNLTVPTDHISVLGALLAQGEYGDYDPRNFASIYSNLKFGEVQLSQSDILSIGYEHKKLSGLNKSQVICFFNKEVAKLPSYGTEVYQAKLECRETPEVPGASPITHTSINVIIRLGPLGLEIVETKTEDIKRIPFTAVQLATHTGKMIDIDVLQDDGSTAQTSFRMPSERSSNAIYRAITEMLAFFTWETVHSSVMHQYSRDFKGHLFALFRSNDADMDKQYVFDVQKTWREVHDSVRRKLYKVSKQCELSEELLSEDEKKKKVPTCQDNEEMLFLQERICAIRDALTCRVCLDKEINTVFWTCGHQVCCDNCANFCQSCPICRQTIEKTQVIFPPISRDFVDGKTNLRKDSSNEADNKRREEYCNKDELVEVF